MSTLHLALRHRLGDFELDVDVQVPLAGVTALLGHSGAGKSSVVAALAGLLRPAAGRIAVGDEVYMDAQRAVWVPPAARRLGCVLQRPLLFPHLTVHQNCQFGGQRRAPTLVVSDFAGVYRLLGLQDLLQRYPRHLSGGEQQRVALARAILSQPTMLVLDEPLSAVDQTRRQSVLAFLARLRDETALPMLYVSHALDEVAQLADRVLVMEAGRVVAHGEVNDVLSGTSHTVWRDGGCVVHGVIDRHDESDGLSVIAFDGGELRVPLTRGARGTAVRLLIRADDVMLSNAALPAVSANNVLAARVEHLVDHADGSVQVHLTCGMTALVARVTRASVRRLGLATGANVYAAFKAERLRAGSD